MAAWDVVDNALAHRRKQMKWLAEELRVSIAVVSNWKSRNKVPAERVREVATALGLTVDQLEGYAPPPWERPAEWPFEDRALYDRIKGLRPEQRLEIQGAMRKMVGDFESGADSAEESRRFLTDDARHSLEKKQSSEGTKAAQ